MLLETTGHDSAAKVRRHYDGHLDEAFRPLIAFLLMAIIHNFSLDSSARI